jgi:hypothetical protein
MLVVYKIRVHLANPDLKPLRTTTLELGAEMRFFGKPFRIRSCGVHG